MSHDWSRLVFDSRKFLWAAFLITLPITSFPYFPPTIGGDVLVRPLSLYPLIVLLALFILPRLFRPSGIHSTRLPKTILPLIFFVLIAAASSLISLLYGLQPALGISVAERTLRGLITLGIGFAIYLAIVLLPDTIDDLRFTLRYIYAGCAVAMTWGAIQATQLLNYNEQIFSWMEKIQGFISTRHLLYDRISGLTYEPHWFADQLILLLLPGVLAAAVSGFTIFRWRKGNLTLEWLLLGWMIIILPFTYSRAGLLNLIVTVLISVLLFGVTRNKKRINQSHTPKNRLAVVASLWHRLRMVILVAVVVVIPIYLVGAQNEFFARIWKFWRQPEALNPPGANYPLSQTLLVYFQHLGFDTRLAYGEAAYKTYASNPWLGVGLGNFSFYIQDTLPLRPLTTEVLRAITPDHNRTRLVTPKNFYLRLLAETGAIGTSTFIAFIIASLGCALYLLLSPEAEWRYWGLTCTIGVIAFLISALTFDSFVIPNTWIVLGMCGATLRVHNLTTHQHRLSHAVQNAGVDSVVPTVNHQAHV